MSVEEEEVDDDMEEKEEESKSQPQLSRAPASLSSNMFNSSSHSDSFHHFHEISSPYHIKNKDKSVTIFIF